VKLTYSEDYIRGLFPTHPRPSENPNVIQHVCSTLEPGMQGVCGWVLVMLEEEETSWNPRDSTDEFEGPLRLTYHQYINGKITIGTVVPY
jgi:hypothetical protein